MEQNPEYIRACYDAVAVEYADRFSEELAHKPLDCQLLRRFAKSVAGRGCVYDLGCGPGQTTAFLHDCGVTVYGVDISPQLLQQARQRHPASTFIEGDMLALPVADASATGLVAFYAIVHFTLAQLRQAFSEMYRVLSAGGHLLLAFHMGEQTVHVEEFLGKAITLDFVFFTPATITEELSRRGFEELECIERAPYPDVEYPSRRAYLFAQKARKRGISEREVYLDDGRDS